MTPRRIMQRPLRLAVALGLVTGAVVLSGPTPASGAALSGSFAASTGFTTSGGGGCALSADTSSSSSGTFPSGGPATSYSFDSSAVATDPSDSADVTQLRSRFQASARSVDSGGVLTSLDLRGQASLTVDRAQDAASSCSSSAGAGMSLSTNPLVLTQPSLLDTSMKVRGADGQSSTQTSFALVFSRATPGTEVIAESHVNNNETTRRQVLLPPGTYQMALSLSTQLAQPGPLPGPETGAITFSLDLDIVPAGSADSVQRGAATKYVALPAGLSCGNGSVKAHFTNKAGPKPKKGAKPKIKKALFYVNDVKVATVKRPHKNTVKTLTGLPPTDAVTVETRLYLTGKGVAETRRTYRPCS